MSISGDMKFFSGKIVNPFKTFANSDSWPSVIDGTHFKTAAIGVALNNLGKGLDGQEVTIVAVNTQTTISDGGNFKLSAAWNPGADDCIVLLYDGTSWIEKSRSTN